MSSYGHAVRVLRPGELQLVNQAIVPWTRCQSKSCYARPVFICSYWFRTEQSQRPVQHNRRACPKHARKFAAKYNLAPEVFAA